MLKKAVSSQVKGKGYVLDLSDVFDTVNNLIEFPTAVLCQFDKKFLQLPKEIIINTLKKQKNFVVVDNTSSKNVLPYFIGVKDGISTDVDTICDGYKKVVTARFEDATFYFKNDTKTKLKDKVEQLKEIVFQEKLGTIYDKVQRVKKLSYWLKDIISSSYHLDISVIDRICFLCKADLSTEIVSEFPEFRVFLEGFVL
jgi:glycyl-tRNA synthetase beta chain